MELILDQEYFTGYSVMVEGNEYFLEAIMEGREPGVLLRDSEFLCACMRACTLSHFTRVRLCATPWTVAHQAPLPMGILQARILEWVAIPSSRASSYPGIEPSSPALQANSLSRAIWGAPQ